MRLTLGKEALLVCNCRASRIKLIVIKELRLNLENEKAASLYDLL